MASPIEQGKAPDPQVRTRRQSSRKSFVPSLPTPENTELLEQLGTSFERRLRREGMPSELPTNIVFTPDLDLAYQKTAGKLGDHLNEEYPNQQIAERLPLPLYEKNIVKEFGEQVGLTDNLKELPELRESIEELVLRAISQEEMEEYLHNHGGGLSRYEKAIIFMRFGINTEEKTPEEIGGQYGVTSELIRRKERQTLFKMRSDIRFASQMYDVYEWENSALSSEADSPVTHAVNFSIPEVPVFDPRDDRPYLVRFKENAMHSAQFWLESKQWEIKPLLYNPRKKLQAKANAKKLRAKIREDQQEVTRQLEPLLIKRRRAKNSPLNPQAKDVREATLFLLDTKIQTLTAYSQLLQSHAPL